jgi:CubicO group peptidase (beta-lactamase class C family)
VWQLAGTLKRKPGVKPCELWSYDTGGAWLVGRVLDKASGTTITRCLETRLRSRQAKKLRVLRLFR